jgi:hypothetical protein
MKYILPEMDLFPLESTGTDAIPRLNELIQLLADYFSKGDPGEFEDPDYVFDMFYELSVWNFAVARFTVIATNLAQPLPAKRLAVGRRYVSAFARFLQAIHADDLMPHVHINLWRGRDKFLAAWPFDSSSIDGVSDLTSFAPCERDSRRDSRLYRTGRSLLNSENLFKAVVQMRIIETYIRRCRMRLSLETRWDILPAFLPDTAPGLWWADSSDDLVIEIDPMVEISDPNLFELATADFGGHHGRLDYDYRNMDVIYSDTIVEGQGATKQFVYRALTNALNPDRPSNELFMYTDDRKVRIRPTSIDSEEKKLHLRNVGRLIGLAIELEVGFYAPFAKGCLHILTSNYPHTPRKSDVISWMEDQDPMTFKSVDNLRKNPSIVSDAELTMISNPELTVDSSNIGQFFLEKAAFETITVNREAMGWITRGIYDIMPYGQLSWISAEELYKLFTAHAKPTTTRELNRAFSVVDDSPTEESINTTEWFFELISELSPAQRSKLVEFVTGSRAAPLGGFAEGALSLWLNHHAGSRDSLPTARLCFLQLQLPLYSSKQVMKRQLVTAIENGVTLELH